MGIPVPPAPTSRAPGTHPERRRHMSWNPTGSCAPAPTAAPPARGLHSSTFQLNLSAFCGIGVAFRGCFEGVWGVIGDAKGYFGCISCQKWLILSWKLDECKPLPPAARSERRRHRSSHSTDSRSAAPTSSPPGARPLPRGLHSFTVQLNLSRVCHKKTSYTT
jgi:hypothetical protein